MNDEERIELVRSFKPHQWSSDQAAEVAQAFGKDAKLQSAVADQLRVEQALTLQFTPELESTEVFIGQLQRRVRSRRRARRMKITTILILLLAVTGSAGYVAYERGWLEKLIVPQGVAQNDDTEDSKKDKQKKKKKPKDDKDDRPGDGKPDDPNAPMPADPMDDPMPDDPNGKPIDDPDGGKTEPMPMPADAVVVEDDPVLPDWKLFDDSAARGNFTWLSNVETLLQPEKGELKKQGNNGTIQLAGKYKLQPPSADGHVIRLRLHTPNRLSFLVRNETQAARIEWRDAWQLVALINSPDAPQKFRVIGGDNGRWRAFRQGTIDLRYQDDQLILARGDIVLITIPMGAPTSITLEAQGQLKLAERLRLQPIALPKRVLDIVSEEVIPPAKREWSVQPDTKLAQVTPQEDGSLLVARNDDSDKELFVGTIVKPQAGLTVTMEATEIALQTGFFFDRPDGQKHAVYVVQHKDDRVLAISPTDKGEAKRNAGAGYFVGDRVWCRGVYGLDFFRLEFSSDGINWGTFLEAPYADTALDKPVHVGMRAANGAGPRGARLTKITTSRPTVLEQLADGQLVSQVPFALNDRFGQPLTLALQLEGAAGARPDGSTEAEWRRACLVAMLGKVPTPNSRHEIASTLMRSVIDDGVDFDKTLAALAALPTRLKIQQNAGVKLNWATHQQMYDQLAIAESQGDRPDNLQRILAAWYAQPLGPGAREYYVPATVFVAPPETIRLALFHGWHRYQWNDAFLWAMQFEYFSRQSDGQILHPAKTSTLGKVVSWIKEQSGDRLADTPDSDPDATQPKRRWPQHPLVDESDRESLNTISEFLAAIESQQFAHACRILTGQFVPDGIVPLGEDGRLAKSTHELMREQIDNSEELQTILLRDFAQLGELRIRQALQNKQFDSLETLATQFHGTPAAGKAGLMLADRDLSMGNFFAAAARYEALLDRSESGERATIAAKFRLARAMSGRLDGEPVTQSIYFDGQPIAADEFEQMIAQLVAERNPGTQDSNNQNVRQLAPGPSGMKLTPLVNAAAQSHGNYKSAHRWIAFRFYDKFLVVHRHGQLQVIELASRRVVWKKEVANPERAYFAGPPARPVVVDGKVILPFFDGNKIVLTCFSLDKGEELWKQPATGHVGGDPILIDASLYVVGIHAQRGNYGDLYMRRIEPATGETVFAKRIARLRTSDAIYRIGSPVLVNDSLLVRSGGALICCDLFGNTRWLRRLTYVPTEVDPSLLDAQHLDDLVISGTHAFLNSAGSPHVICVDSTTGNEIWSRFSPALRRVVGQVGDHLIIVEGDQIVALDVDNGKTVWSSATTADYQSVILGKDDTIVAITLNQIPAGQQPTDKLRRRIDWLSGQDGSLVKSADVLDQGDKYFDAGKIVTNGRVIVTLANLKSAGMSGDVVVLEQK
jgi:outer membrane protein assembly factor BamB